MRTVSESNTDNTETEPDWLSEARELPDDMYRGWTDPSGSALTEAEPKQVRRDREGSFGAILDSMTQPAYVELVNASLNGVLQQNAIKSFPPRGLVREKLLKHLERMSRMNGDAHEAVATQPIVRTDAERIDFLQRIPLRVGIAILLRTDERRAKAIADDPKHGRTVIALREEIDQVMTAAECRTAGVKAEAAGAVSQNHPNS